MTRRIEATPTAFLVRPARREVEVDLDTCEATRAPAHVAHEIGKAIHPVLAEAQIEGGVRAGARLGAARRRGDEDGRHGERASSPTTSSPPHWMRRAIDVEMLEHPYSHGPFGAKGVGELPIDGAGAGGGQRDRAATGSIDARFPPRRAADGLRRGRRARTRVTHGSTQAERRKVRGRAPHEAAARRAARGLRAHRHQGRLRRRRVRRLHGAARRRAGELVPRAGAAGRRREHHHRRRARGGASCRTRPASVPRARRRAVRHLHAGNARRLRLLGLVAGARPATTTCGRRLAGNLCRCTGYGRSSTARAAREANARTTTRTKKRPSRVRRLGKARR